MKTAESREERGDLNGAEEAYSAVAYAAPSDESEAAREQSHALIAEAGYRLGQLLARSGQLGRADVVYQVVIEGGHPEFGPRAAVTLAALVADRDPFRARELLEGAVNSRHPEVAPAASLELGRVLLDRLSDPASAEKALRVAIEAGDRETAAWATYEQGRAFERQGAIEQAARAYAIAHRSGSPDVRAAVEQSRAWDPSIVADSEVAEEVEPNVDEAPAATEDALTIDMALTSKTSKPPSPTETAEPTEAAIEFTAEVAEPPTEPGEDVQVRPLLTLAHGGPIRGLAFSPDGVRIVTGSDDGHVRLWAAETGAPLQEHRHESTGGGTAAAWIRATVFAPDGSRYAYGSADGAAWIRDSEDGSVVRRLRHKGPVRTVAFSPDGRWLASGSEDAEVVVWDLTTPRPRAVGRLPHEGTVRAVAFSPDGHWLATASEDRWGRIWDPRTGAEPHPLPHGGAVRRVAWSPDGRWLATGSADNYAALWDAETGTGIHRLIHADSVWSVAFSPDGGILATASTDSTARLWDVETGEELRLLPHDGRARGAVFSPDGRFLATASSDGAARVWDVRSGEQLRRFEAGAEVRILAWAPDGRRLAVGADDGGLRIWATDDLEALREPEPTPAAVAPEPVGVAVAAAIDAFRSGYSTDLVATTGPLRDHLNMEREVDALSWIVADEKAQPPLAVGLFGDWGAGKSTFMQLMQRRVRKIASDARRAQDGGDEHPSCGYVRQITFNAWHYADANLWASLVAHIFDELARPEPTDDGTPATMEIDNLLKRLETARTLREEAEARQAAAAEERRHRLAELEDAKGEREATARDRRPERLMSDVSFWDAAGRMSDAVGSDRWRTIAPAIDGDATRASLDRLATDPDLLRKVISRLPDAADRERWLAVLESPTVVEAARTVAGGDGAWRRLADSAAAAGIDASLPGQDLRTEMAALGAELDKLSRQAAEVTEIARDVHRTAGRLRYLWRLTAATIRRRPVVLGLPLVAVLVGLGAAGLLIGAGFDLVGTAVALSGLLAAVIPLVREPLQTVSRLVDGAVEAVEEPRRRQIELLEAREAELQREADAAGRDERDAQREIDDIRQGRRLVRYIEERAASSDYRRHLGIVASVRKDFERLTELMNEARAARRQRFEARRARAAEAEADAEPSMANVVVQQATPAPDEPAEEPIAPTGLPEIDRVVLYIDDLDRCPADRVVQVLEAVHLMLALPLFVVVVGVDSRWLLRSLRHHYSAQLAGEDGGAGGHDHRGGRDEDRLFWESTPQNYLEKIFQIPFSIRPMAPGGFEALVDDLLAGATSAGDGEGATAAIDTAAAAGTPTAIDGTAPTEAPGAGEPGAADEEVDGGPMRPGIADAGGGEVEEPATAGSVVLAAASSGTVPAPRSKAAPTGPEPPADDAEAEPAAEPEPEPEPAIERPPVALTISPAELAYLKRLAPFVVTPRAAKRLVNTYRLLRVLVTPAERERFEPPPGRAEYQVAVTLLGILIGFPNQAGPLYVDLIGAGDPDWGAFRKRAIDGRGRRQPGATGASPAGNGNEAAAASPATGARGEGEPPAAPSMPPAAGAADDAEEWRRLSRLLEGLAAESTLPADLRPFRYWARRVSRFSFQTGRLISIAASDEPLGAPADPPG